MVTGSIKLGSNGVKGGIYYEKVAFFWRNKKKAVSLHTCLLTKTLIFLLVRTLI